MRKSLFSLVALVPALLLADAWRPSEFELRGWNHAMPLTEPSDKLFSPIGFAISVAMLGEGTGGNHRANIAEALGLLSDFGNAFSYVFKSYAEASASNAVNITFAPSLWTRQRKKLDLDYRRSLQRNFEAETGSLASALPINAWTEAKTDGRITTIIDKVDPRTEVLLLNAVAFEGAWAKGFDPARTTSEPFTREDGGTTNVMMMHGELQEVVRVRNSHVAAIRVPFAAAGMSMLYLLPPAGTPIRDLRDNLTRKTSIDGIKSLFRAQSGADVDVLPLKVALPRMENLSRWDLLSSLAVFKVPASGYPRIGEDFKINEVIQAAYIKIAETGYSLTPGATPPPKQEKRRSWREREEDEERRAMPRESFILNRPFLYFVWDEKSDTLLLAGQFMGR